MRVVVVTAISGVVAASCASSPGRSSSGASASGSASAGAAVVDRFSPAAGHLQRRDKSPGLPAPGEPIDLDKPPFITQGLGPDGSVVRYYNFDVQSPTPARMIRALRGGAVVAEIVDVIPGQAGYSDFWTIDQLELPAGVTVTSVADLDRLPTKPTKSTKLSGIIDCPIVPPGTTARLGSPVRHSLWYRGTRVECLAFGEPLTSLGGTVPTSPIYVTFGSEPTQGFATEGNTPQTHNVVFTLPSDTDYSPLWQVHVYDREAFASVHDASSVLAAPIVEEHGPLVNCPIVDVHRP